MKILIHSDFYKLYTDKKTQKRIKDAVFFFCDHYKLNDHNYILKISFNKSSVFISEQVIAVFQFDKLHRTGYMHLRGGQETDKLVESIFHELAHFRQYLRGDLKVIPLVQEMVWKEKLYQGVYNNPSSVPYDIYYNFPWEIEARETTTEALKLFNKKYSSFYDKLKFWSK